MVFVDVSPGSCCRAGVSFENLRAEKTLVNRSDAGSRSPKNMYHSFYSARQGLSVWCAWFWECFTICLIQLKHIYDGVYICSVVWRKIEVFGGNDDFREILQLFGSQVSIRDFICSHVWCLLLLSLKQVRFRLVSADDVPLLDGHVRRILETTYKFWRLEINIGRNLMIR